MKKAVITLLLSIFYAGAAFPQGVQDDPLEAFLYNFQYQKALEYIEAQQPAKKLLLQKALCYKALQNNKRAIDILHELSLEYADDIQIKFELADCYKTDGRYDLAVRCYDDLIRIDSNNVYFNIQKADFQYSQGEYSDALDAYKNAHEKYQFPSAVKRIAQCYEKLNKPDSAKLYYEIAWHKDTTDSHIAASMINLNIKTKNYRKAMSFSDMYMQRDSTDKQINLLNALSYYAADLYEDAIPRFRKCYLNGDSSLIVNRSLGIAYYSIKDNHEAEIFLDNAYRQDTTNNNVLYCLAVVSNELGDHRKAILLFNKLLDRVIPADLTLYLYYKNLASAYDKGSDFEKSAAAYTEALKYAAKNQKMAIYYMLGRLYTYSIKDKKKALEYFGLYKTSLNEYMNDIKSKPETDPDEVKDTEMRLKDLDEYLRELEKSNIN